MNTLAVCFLLALAASAQGGAVRRSTDSNSLPSLSDLMTMADQHLTDFNAAIRDLFTPGEQREAAITKVGDNINNQTQALAQHVQTLVNNLRESIKGGEPNEALQQAADRLNGTVRQLLGEENASEVQRANEQLSESVKNAVQTVVEEANKISKSVESDTAPVRAELQVATRTAVKQALDVADSLRQAFEQAIASPAQPSA